VNMVEVIRIVIVILKVCGRELSSVSFPRAHLHSHSVEMSSPAVPAMTNLDTSTSPMMM
jgi:hypothetical protein